MVGGFFNAWHVWCGVIGICWSVEDVEKRIGSGGLNQNGARCGWNSISLVDFSFFISPLLTTLPDMGSNNKRLTGESIYSPSWQEEREGCLFDRGHRPKQPTVLNLTFEWLNMGRTKIDWQRAGEFDSHLLTCMFMHVFDMLACGWSP